MHFSLVDAHVRVQIIGHSYAFNTNAPSKLVLKLRDLGPSGSICGWVLELLTNRPQKVDIQQMTVINIGVPQGCCCTFYPPMTVWPGMRTSSF